MEGVNSVTGTCVIHVYAAGCSLRWMSRHLFVKRNALLQYCSLFCPCAFQYCIYVMRQNLSYGRYCKC